MLALGVVPIAVTEFYTVYGDTGARGPVEVPLAPQRVAALVGSVDVDVLALGVTPVFAGSRAEGWVNLPEGVVTNDSTPPDVEVLAAVPDLLLGWEWLVDDPAWPMLTALAPAVPLSVDATWQETFLVVADAVNRRERGEAELAAFDARVTALRERLAQREPIQVGQLGFTEPGIFRWFGQDRDTTEIMRSIGLDAVGPRESNQEAGFELLGRVTAPWLIVFGSGDDGTGLLTGAKANPLWATLPAVQAGQVLQVDGDLWTGAGFLWAQALVAVYAAVLEAGGYCAETEQSSRVAILTSLGFPIPREFDALAGDASYAEISEEQLGQLDRDVLVWETGSARSAIEQSPLYNRLDVAREGRDVFVTDEVLAGAMAFISVLSLPLVLDRLVPMLAAAVDGDPATEVPPQLEVPR